MKDHYYNLFRNLPCETLPKELAERIAKEIVLLEKRVILVRRLSFGSVAAVFLSAFIPALNFLVTQFEESSFFSYASLAISDSDLTFLHSQEFLFSLIESLPLLGITFALTLVFFLLGAIRIILAESRQAAEFFTTRTA